MPKRAPNWDNIKAEYLRGGTSYAKLAAKHGVNRSTLEKRAGREHWADDLQQVCGEVAAEIHAAAVASRVMSAQEVLERLSNFARGGMGRIGSWGAGGLVLRESGDLSADDLALVVEVSETRTKDGGSLRVKLGDPMAALDRLAKHHKLYEDDPSKLGDGQPGGVVEIPAMDPAPEPPSDGEG